MNSPERHHHYEELYNTEIIPRIPVIIKANIKNFSKFRRNLPRPFSPTLQQVISEATYATISDIDDAIFAYQRAGEIIFVLRNDLDKSLPYCSNNVQKISSIVSSNLTLNFLKHLLMLDEEIDIIGEGVFEASTFGVPSVDEAMNYLLWKQKTHIYYAISSTLEYELSQIYDEKDVRSITANKNVIEKKELLQEECNITYEMSYPEYFRHGLLFYKAPKIMKFSAKKKWIVDENAPDFMTKDGREFITNILQTGQDIFRPERD